MMSFRTRERDLFGVFDRAFDAQVSKYSDLQGHLVFIENYAVHIARQMISDCDIWLNTPLRPPADS